MTRFFVWLKTPAKSTVLLITVSVLLGWTFVFLMAMLVMLEIIPGTGDWIGLDEMTDEVLFISLVIMIVLTPFMALVEELIFRAPLSLLHRKSPSTVIVGAIILSVMFGYIHGGRATVLSHGIAGLIQSLVYLKAGGSRGEFWRPFVISSIVHILHNWGLYIPIAILMSIELQ